MLYLFWWQAVIEIAANFIQLLRLKLPLRIAFAHLKHVAFLLGIYFIFIMVIFGIIFSYSPFSNKAIDLVSISRVAWVS